MKNIRRFGLLATFLITVFLVTNCAQQPGQLPVSKSDGGNIQSCPPGSASSGPCKDIIDQISSYDEEISRLRTTTSPDDSIATEMFTLRGYRFSLDEMGAMVDSARAKGDSSIYLMFAINKDPQSVQHRRDMDSPIKYLDVYLQIKGKDGAVLVTSHAEPYILDDYADFPRPCPPSCPGQE
ncbi:MAG: hypothetical protein R3D00_00070 [Bacteroidia bacterium]